MIEVTEASRSLCSSCLPWIPWEDAFFSLDWHLICVILSLLHPLFFIHFLSQEYSHTFSSPYIVTHFPFSWDLFIFFPWCHVFTTCFLSLQWHWMDGLNQSKCLPRHAFWIRGWQSQMIHFIFCLFDINPYNLSVLLRVFISNFVLIFYLLVFTKAFLLLIFQFMDCEVQAVLSFHSMLAAVITLWSFKIPWICYASLSSLLEVKITLAYSSTVYTNTTLLFLDSCPSYNPIDRSTNFLFAVGIRFQREYWKRDNRVTRIE